MTDYSGIVGLQITLLKSKRDGKTRIRVLHDELTRVGDDGIATLEALEKNEIEVLYRKNTEKPLADAHCVILRGRGLTANICPV